MTLLPYYTNHKLYTQTFVLNDRVDPSSTSWGRLTDLETIHHHWSAPRWQYILKPDAMKVRP